MAKLPPAPTYFQKPVSALNGHRGAVVRPERCEWLNYEGEIAIVIGRTCRNVAPADAGRLHRRVHGRQRLRPPRLPRHRLGLDAARQGQSDTLCPVGPGLVTDWDFHGKRITTSVNGTIVQDGNTDEMEWDMHYLVADIARNITLEPGDLLLSGTPANSRPVQPGDVVTVEVEGLGALENHIVAGPAPIRDDVGAQPTELGGGALHGARRRLGVPRHPAAAAELTWRAPPTASSRSTSCSSTRSSTGRTGGSSAARTR